MGLFGKGVLQREQISELSCASFPHCFGSAEVAVLLEEPEPQIRLTRNYPLGRFLRARNQAEERRLAASVPAQDAPAVAQAYSECYSLEDPRRAELDTDIRDGYLGQERSTLEHAARQRSSDSMVWSPMWPIRKVELFSLP